MDETEINNILRQARLVLAGHTLLKPQHEETTALMFLQAAVKSFGSEQRLSQAQLLRQTLAACSLTGPFATLLSSPTLPPYAAPALRSAFDRLCLWARAHGAADETLLASFFETNIKYFTEFWSGQPAAAIAANMAEGEQAVRMCSQRSTRASMENENSKLAPSAMATSSSSSNAQQPSGARQALAPNNNQRRGGAELLMTAQKKPVLAALPQRPSPSPVPPPMPTPTKLAQTRRDPSKQVDAVVSPRPPIERRDFESRHSGHYVTIAEGKFRSKIVAPREVHKDVQAPQPQPQPQTTTAPASASAPPALLAPLPTHQPPQQQPQPPQPQTNSKAAVSLARLATDERFGGALGMVALDQTSPAEDNSSGSGGGGGKSEWWRRTSWIPADAALSEESDTSADETDIVEPPSRTKSAGPLQKGTQPRQRASTSHAANRTRLASLPT
eukprot:m.12224 g.12224  ORF g.12224 m.12224 type:complete len:444 (+) comp6175_c0_seq1:95-1426(+)